MINGNKNVPTDHKSTVTDPDLEKVKLQKDNEQLKQQIKQLKSDNENFMNQMTNERTKISK